MRQYCSVCRSELEMEVVPTADGEEDGVLWLRCPGCQGYLPKIDSGGLTSRRREEAAPGSPADSRRDAAPATGGRQGWPGADEAGVAGGAGEADDEEATGEDSDDGDEADEDGVAAAAAAGAVATTVEEPPLSLDEADFSRALPYRPWESYEVGAVIHHLAWGDFGVVRAKETLPGRRQAIKVQFEKSGVVRLIEQSREES